LFQERKTKKKVSTNTTKMVPRGIGYKKNNHPQLGNYKYKLEKCIRLAFFCIIQLLFAFLYFCLL